MLASHPFAKNANGWGTGLGSFPPIHQRAVNGWGTEHLAGPKLGETAVADAGGLRAVGDVGLPPIRKEREWMGHRAWELPTHSQRTRMDGAPRFLVRLLILVSHPKRKERV
jgi:hypothetical protein